MRILFDENAPDKLVEGIQAFTFLFETIVELEITSIKLLGKISASDRGFKLSRKK